MAKVNYYQHPVFQEILQLTGGGYDRSLMTFKVYMDMCEDKGWWNVKCHACKQLSVVFLSGHASRNKPRDLVLPVSVGDSFSQETLHKYLHTIKLEGYQSDSVILALSADDGSTVYFKVTEGLVLPEPPEMTDWKKYRREERLNLQRQHVTLQRQQYTEYQQKQQQQHKQPQAPEHSLHTDVP